MGTVSMAAAGRPSGRRCSSQIVKRVKNPKITVVQAIFMGKPLFLYDAPLMRHQSPVGGRGERGYNDSELLEIV
jgi:hypothetical protein